MSATGSDSKNATRYSEMVAGFSFSLRTLPAITMCLADAIPLRGLASASYAQRTSNLSNALPVCSPLETSMEISHLPGICSVIGVAS